MREIHSKVEVLSEEELKMIHESTLEILEDVGFEIPHSEILNKLKDGGAFVDFKHHIVKFPKILIMNAIHKVPKKFVVENSDNNITVNDGKIKLTMCTSPFIFDYPIKKARQGTTEDILRAITLGNHLPSIATVQTEVLPSNEFPGKVADVICYQLLYTYCSKPCNSYIYSSKSADYIIEMAKIVAGSTEQLKKKKILSYFAESISPLRFSNHTLEIMIKMAKYDLPITLGPMVTAGISGPVTLAGTLILENAEVLATIAIIHLLNPNQPVYYGGLAHVGDMKTARCSYGSPEQTLLALAEIQLARKYGLACGCNVGLSDSNLPDFQAGIEKGVSVSLAAAAGAEFFGILGLAEQGFIGGGSNSGANLEQLIIDNEWIDYINRIFRGFEVNKKTLAVDLIKKVGVGGNFLNEEHTARYMRKELWNPHLFNRDSWETWTKKGAKKIEERASEKIKEILEENYPPEPVIDRKTAKELKKITERATSELL